MDKNLITRAITGAVYVATAVGCTLYGEVTLAILSAIIAIFCIREYYTLCGLGGKGSIFYQSMGALLLATFFGISMLVDDHAASFEWVALTVILLAGWVYYVLKNSLQIEHAAKFILGWLYILIPMFLFYKTSMLTGTYDGMGVLMVFVLLWSTDTFAYLVGRKWGKHKLAPGISPGKSIEGFIGGLIGSMLVAVIFYYQLNQNELSFYLGAAAIICIFGVLGDLMESKIKRQAGVKDSGNLLPGHGGFLDRFDSMLLAAPAYYVYCRIYFLGDLGL